MEEAQADNVVDEVGQHQSKDYPAPKTRETSTPDGSRIVANGGNLENSLDAQGGPHAGSSHGAPSNTVHEMAQTPLMVPDGLLSSAAFDLSQPLKAEEGLATFPDIDADPTLSCPDEDAWDAIDHTDGAQSIMETRQIQAFAKLEFDDGEFYMNTYAVELGRDIRAARLASELDPQPPSRKRSRSSGGRSRRSKSKDGRHFASSVVSESGGVIGVDSPTPDSETKPRRSKAKSISSSSQQLSRKSSLNLSNVPKRDYNALALESMAINNPGGSSQHPSPDMVPLIPIHPPAVIEGISTGHKSISRKHIRISFNFEKHLFEVEILGRNGGFVDDEWYAPGEIQPLVSGSILQVGGVGVRFVLPDVPEGETGAENAELGLGSDPMSGGPRSFDLADSDEEQELDDEDESETHDGVKDEDSEEEQIRPRKGETTGHDLDPPKPRRKGPGRPPKNGIISKREQALQAKQAREDERTKAEGKSKPSQGRGKGKTAKIPEPEASSLQPNGKRKYTKRKRAGGDEHQVRESTEQTDSVPPEHAATAKSAKPKPLKPPRSPSPVFDESTLTPEQLAKPQSSYVVLIHEALSNSKSGQMSLPQIYRAIERRYPFFKLRVQTQGWQSSVRHNLSQHPAFRKIERDGKGWMWGLVPEVSIEKEKKRRPTPPPTQPQQQHYYPQPAPPYPQHSFPYPSMPNGQIPQFPYGMPPIPYPPGSTGFPLPFKAPQQESTYSSPYASSAPAAPAAATQTTSKETKPSTEYPTPSSQLHFSQQPGSTSKDLPISNNTPTTGSIPPAATIGQPRRHTPDILAAVAKFKIALIDSMDDKAHAEKVVSSAINRTLGLSLQKLTADVEISDEAKITAALEDMLSTMEKKRSVQGIASETTKSDSATTSTTTNTASSTSGAVAAKGETVAEKAADIARKIPLLNSSSGTISGGKTEALPDPAADVKVEAGDSGGGASDRAPSGSKRPLERTEDGANGEPEVKKIAA